MPKNSPKIKKAALESAPKPDAKPTAPENKNAGAETLPKPEAKPATIPNAFETVRKVLTKLEPGFVSKAQPSGKLAIPSHDQFRPAAFEKVVEATDTIEDLLRIEQQVMIQLERIDALQAAIKTAGTGAVNLISHLESRTALLDAEFTHMMKKTKAADRKLETAAWSLRVFFDESRVASEPEIANQVYVLNVDADDLVRNPKFGEKHRFGSLKDAEAVHDEIFGLWVLGTKILNSESAARIGVKALEHSAMAVLNLDADTNIDDTFRRDSRGVAARFDFYEPQVKTEREARNLAETELKPLGKEQLEWINNCVGDIAGLERAVLCFSPLRVRTASAYEAALGDVCVSSSYAYAGKLAFVAMVSKEKGITTAVSRAKDEFKIPRYTSSAPFLYSHKGHVTDIPDKIIVGISETGGENSESMKKMIEHFTGLHTARGLGEKYQVQTEMAYDQLRRLMRVVAQKYKGASKSEAEQIVREVEELLQANLMGIGDPRKPFTWIKVVNDTTSPEGREADRLGAIRLVVTVGSKYAIPEVWVHIAKTRSTSGEGERPK